MHIVFTYFFLFLLLSPGANARFTLEPAVSYQAGKIDQGPIEGMASLTGPAVSLRTGMSLTNHLEIGVEGLYGDLAQEYQDNPQVTYGATYIQGGAYLAGNFSVCRLWTGIYPLSQLDIPSRDQKFTGIAGRVGIGIPVVWNLNVNLDYTAYNFTQLETSAGKFDIPYDTGTSSAPFDVSTFTLSLSYILNL